MRQLRIFPVILVMIGVLAAGAEAQVPSPFNFYIGAGYGKLTWENSPGGSVGFTAGGMYNIPATGLSLGAEVGYLMLGSKDMTDGIPPATRKHSFSAVPLTAQAYYHLPVPGSFTPWATAGFGLYDYRVDVGSDNNHDTKSGFNVGLGSDLALPESGFKFGLDLRYHIINTDGESTKLVTAMARMYL